MEEVSVLIERAQAGDSHAREVLIEKNLGLVHAIVRRFIGRGYDLEDLFQIGTIGLIKSIDKFDLELGVKFSTYAVPVILGEMKRLFRDGGTVKVGRSLKELSIRATRETEEFRREQGRDPIISELAERLKVSVSEAAEALNAAIPPMSLTDEEEESGQWDVRVDSPEEGIAERLALEQVVNELEPRDREIIRMRFYQRKTQTQTAQALGMTQVQISRRERVILGQLRLKLTG